eukprot:TRINITY_DN2020_c0_g3_i1.p1 TRINITY_DN2020_c0_g3~~TRINITY_DN2020_c0_g3_i1.p1  ORF type:complete len:664 (-),score=171.71 TRINITY_DN2020_c0_g3_i1:1320-3311(-)
MDQRQVIKSSRVLNKAPNASQITAEQLMREAWDHQEAEQRAPRQKITDMEELTEYRLRKRTEFENGLKIKRYSMPLWVKYAKWEESQQEWERARSIFERALEIDYMSVTVWLKYAEFEMRSKNVNHARNLYDRAIQLLPRVDQFWFKYIHMEDMLANYAKVRQLYERWVEWEPDAPAWNSYIKFETRNGETERVRNIFKRYVMCHQTPKVWLRFARFEQKHNEVARAREIFQQSLEILDEESTDLSPIYIAFAEFEEREKEFERARTIYKYALDRITKDKARDLFNKFIMFEKQHGDRESIEHIIVGKRRFQYEEMIADDPMNYDVWFDYLRLEESNGNPDKVRELYERAISSDNMPPMEKPYWKRYLFIWINYALYEELVTQDMERARMVYQTLVKVIPHKKFTFKKIWIMFANFEIRRKNLDNARKVFGHALGMAPSDKIYIAYIELEMQLGNIDRCRKLYEKWLEWMPENCQAWTKFAKLESDLEELDRARGILELAIQQPALDMPELIWKFYIDFEIEWGEYDRARDLYKRLLQRTKHVKVWISFAKFETSLNKVKKARDIYDEAFQALKPAEFTTERVVLIEAWREFEEEFGDKESKEKVIKNMPTRVKKRRKIQTADGQDAGMEEYYDYVFPDTKSMRTGLKLIEAAQKWKQQQNQS